MMMEKPKVRVILPDWNGREDTLSCVDSLESRDYPHLEIVAVDQGSQDGLVETLRRREPHVKVIANQKNLGFAGGNNQGTRYALENGDDYILLLNNDTIVHRRCISELLAAAECNPAVGTVGPKIHYLDEPERIWSVGGSSIVPKMQVERTDTDPIDLFPRVAFDHFFR